MSTRLRKALLALLVLPGMLPLSSCVVAVPAHEGTVEYQASEGQLIVEEAPPPPREEVIVGVAPGPDYVWIGGYWTRQSTSWFWVSGRWAARPRPNAVWMAGHWERHPRGHVWVGGRWR